MEHRVDWSEYNASRAIRWLDWSVNPKSHNEPPKNATEMEALNFMGERNWDIVHVEVITQRSTDMSREIPSRRYLFKRQK